MAGTRPDSSGTEHKIINIAGRLPRCAMLVRSTWLTLEPLVAMTTVYSLHVYRQSSVIYIISLTLAGAEPGRSLHKENNNNHNDAFQGVSCVRDSRSGCNRRSVLQCL